MQITPHFALREFSQPARHGLPAIAYPEQWIETRLRPLCEVLEVIRAELGGHSVRIISGYRSAKYNARIGGAAKSRHMQGDAADIVVDGVSPKDVHICALDLHHQKVIRLGGLGRYGTFSHIDIRPGLVLARWTGKRTAAETA